MEWADGAIGEIASDVIVNNLKEWFENLSPEQKQAYNTTVGNLKDSLLQRIESNIQPSVEAKTRSQGGSTLVCAIIGKNDTLIANVGDSRAYIFKDKKLIQLSREDTVAEENLKKEKTKSKDAMRFDMEGNILVQCLGMDRRKLIEPHCMIIKNTEYDLLMLFTDGVTDCLSEDDIVAVCRTTDKKELTNKLVEQAIRHDSIAGEELLENDGINSYIPGGKDNTTAAIYIPLQEETEQER